MKKCFRCNVEKPLDEFYRHQEMGDGHLGKCKECTKEDVHRNRQENPNPRIYDKKRYQENAERRAKVHAISHKNRTRWPEKCKARSLLGSALRCGRIIRPLACSICGTTERRIEGHHPDYSKPLEVIWCCTPCHRKLDGITKPLNCEGRKIAREGGGEV